MVYFPGELYVYSRNDPLCDSDALEKYLVERQKRPIKSELLKLGLDTSPHCGHIRSHFKAYAEQVDALHNRAVEPMRERACVESWKIPRHARL